MGARRMPWWEKLSEALKYVHEGYIRCDGRVLCLSGGLLRNPLIRRKLVADGVIYPLCRLYQDPAIRQAFDAPRRENGLPLTHPLRVVYKVDPDKADGIRQQLLLRRPKARVVWCECRGQRRLCLEFEEGDSPDFRWDES